MPLTVQADPDVQARPARQLVATAEREGIGVTARPEPEDQRARASAGRVWPASPGARARGAIVVGVAAGTLALSGVSVASGDAMPGDALYGVKRSTERAQLALAGSDLTRGQLYLDFARTRLHRGPRRRARTRTASWPRCGTWTATPSRASGC